MPLQISDHLAIDESELVYVADPSSGPGGQNVNRNATRVTVLFDVAAAADLDEAQRQRIRERLATRINRAGVLRVTSQRERSQAANRRAATARFVELLREALAEDPPRRPTRPSRRARERRLEAKRQRSRRKAERGRGYDSDS